MVNDRIIQMGLHYDLITADDIVLPVEILISTEEN